MPIDDSLGKLKIPEQRIVHSEEPEEQEVPEETSKPVSTDCYYCASQFTDDPIKTPHGVGGVAFGCCSKCHAFACGIHGDRDNARGFFRCVLCISGQSVLSAATKGDVRKLSLELAALLGYSLSELEVRSVDLWYIESQEAFLKRYPNLSVAIRESLDTSMVVNINTHDSIQDVEKRMQANFLRLLESIQREADRTALLHLAIVLLKKTNIPEALMPAGLRFIFRNTEIGDRK